MAEEVTNATVYHGLNGITEQSFNNTRKLEDAMYKLEKAILVAGVSITASLLITNMILIILTLTIASN